MTAAICDRCGKEFDTGEDGVFCPFCRTKDEWREKIRDGRCIIKGCKNKADNSILCSKHSLPI